MLFFCRFQLFSIENVRREVRVCSYVKKSFFAKVNGAYSNQNKIDCSKILIEQSTFYASDKNLLLTILLIILIGKRLFFVCSVFCHSINNIANKF